MKISFSFEIASAPSIVAREIDRVEEFEEELLYCLEEGTDTLYIDLVGPYPGKFAAYELIEIILEHTRSIPDTRSLCLHVTSARIARKLQERLTRHEQEPIRCSLGGIAVELSIQDITRVEVDAIVNASNTRLILGAGVSGAIRRAANPSLQAAMSALAPIDPGAVVATPSHGLPHTSWILHAATASGEPEVIARATRASLALAKNMNLSSLAIPALGTGTGGLDARECAAIMREAILTAKHHASAAPLPDIHIALWDSPTFLTFQDIFAPGS